MVYLPEVLPHPRRSFLLLAIGADPDKYWSNWILSSLRFVGQSGSRQPSHLFGDSISHAEMSHIILTTYKSNQSFSLGRTGGEFPRIESCQMLINLPLPGIQLSSSLNLASNFLQRENIGETWLFSCSLSRHRSLGPKNYLLLITWLHQDGLESTIFQSSLAPIAIFWIFKSLICSPP